MGFVDQDARAVALRHFEEFGESADVAVHRIDALDHDQLLALRLSQLALEIQRIVVAEEDSVRLGQDGAVDDRRVRVLVDDDRVSRAHKPGDEAHVGAVAGREDDDRFLALEPGELRVEFLVNIESTGKDGRPRRAEPVLLNRLDRGLLDFRTVRDAEIVVGGHVDQVMNATGLAIADMNAGFRRSLKGFGIEVVAVGQGLPIPLGKRPNQVHRVVARSVIEVRVVVFREVRAGVGFWGHEGDPRRGRFCCPTR